MKNARGVQRTTFFSGGCCLAVLIVFAPPLSSSLPRSLAGRRFRRHYGRGVQKKIIPPFECDSKSSFSLCGKTKIRKRFSEFRPFDQGGRPAWPHSLQQGLDGEDGTQTAADPSRDGNSAGDILHKHSGCGIQRLVMGNTFTVTRERLLLKAGTEERRQEKSRRCRGPVLVQCIEVLKVCVN